MKKINRARLVQRITSKYLLTELQPETFSLSETAIPVVSLDSLAKISKSTIAIAAVSGTGWVLMYTVPNGKRVNPYSIRARVSSGTFTYTAIGVEKRDDSSGQIVIEEGTAATTRLTVPQGNLQLEQGDKIYFFVDSYSVAGNAQIAMWFDEEDAY